MMNPPRPSRALGILGMLACLTLTSCKTKSQGGKSDESSRDASGAAAAPGKACEKLAKRFCDEVGEEDPTCESAKIVVGLLADSACQAGIDDFAATKSKLEKQGKKCDALVKRLCDEVGTESESCALVKAKTKDIPPAHCQTMLDHVDEIVADLKRQEQANKPLNEEQQAKIAGSDAPSFGPANAKVTVVEFSDFECPYCSRAATVTNQAKAKYGDKVRFVFRQFPLSFHQNAKLAAQAALAANEQGKFWEFHDKLFENQRNLAREALEGFAKDVGLDVGKFKKALDDGQAEKRIETDLALGNEVTVQGTPTMFVNGKRVANPTDFDEVSQAIERALGS